MFRVFTIALIFTAYFASSVNAQDDIERVLNDTDVAGSVQPSSGDLGDWEPSEEMYKDLPYYQAGYDLKNRPVIVIELGKWRLAKYYQSNEESAKNALRYVELLCNRLKPNSRAFNAPNGVYMIFDYDGWSLDEFSIPGVPQNYIHLGSQLNELFDPTTMGIVSININLPAQKFLNFLKPVIDALVAASALIEADKTKISATLLKDVPQDQLPERYGGTRNFKPAKTFTRN